MSNRHSFARVWFVLLLLAVGPSQAFKIDTHLWVGQQVINDLEDDGLISINLGGGRVNLPVRADIRTAILQNKNEYLLGHIGPDAMPDLVVGQSIMHPGGFVWKANDWARYLLRAAGNNSVGKAFAYGYLGHGAADVWAHTYINHYAGDHFDLENGETLTEERHIALEGYIAKVTPSLFSSTGVYLGKGFQTVRTSDALAAYVRDALIYSSEAQDQYRQQPTTAHMVAFKAYRTALDNAANSDVWRRLDTAIVRIVASEYGVNLSSVQAGQVLDEVARLNAKINQGINVSQQELNDLNARVTALDLRLASGAVGAFNRVVALESSLISAQAELELRLIEKACDEVDNICKVYLPPRPCPSWRNPFRFCTDSFTDPICAATFRATCRAASELLTLRTQATLALSNQRSKVAGELLSLHQELSSARAAMLQLSNALIDLAQIPTQGSSPMQAVLNNWRSDADLIFADYVKAATQAMINTTVGSSQSALTPLQAWVDCNGPALMGVPLVVSGCTTRESARRVFQTLDRLANLPADSLAAAVGLPTSRDLQALKARLLADVTDKVSAEVTRGVIRLVPDKYQGILQVLQEDWTETKLQTYFNKPGELSRKLLAVPDIALRVNREMNVGNGIFDATRFAAVANAVTLSKLALLDNAGLLQLAALAGAGTRSDGQGAFTGVDNIMADAFASFDGNHQWLDAAPPRTTSSPIENSYRPPELNASGKPVYPFGQGYRTVAGFEPWHSTLRDSLFRKIFVGPISPAIENPDEVGISVKLLPDSYPYRACFAKPFPNSWNENQCDGILRSWTQPPAPIEPTPPPPVRRPPRENCGGSTGRACP